MEFDEVIAPLGRDAFLARHWEQSWLHLPGQTGRFAGLLSWDELAAMLENTRMAPPHIRLSRDGHIIAPDRYVHTLPGTGNLPRLDPGRLVALLAEGATLVLQGVEDLAPRVRALSSSIREALKARVHVNLYAGWRSENGFDLHWDAHEVMVLQLHGRKRWQIFRPTQDYPLDNGIPPKPAGPPVWDGMLNAGDVLYLPRGWWHIAHPVSEPSMHLTFGIAPMHGLNLLNWVAKRLREDPHLRQNLPVLRDAGARPAHMAQIRAAVAAMLSDTAIDAFLQEVDEQDRGRPTLRLPQAPLEQLQALRPTSRIRLASSFHLSLKEDGDKVTFKAYDQSYSVPAYVRPALGLLAESRAVSFAELCAAVQGPAAIDSLTRGLGLLARAGVVLVEQEPDTL